MERVKEEGGMEEQRKEENVKEGDGGGRGREQHAHIP